MVKDDHPEGEHHPHHGHDGKRSFLSRGFIPALGFVLFIILFAVIFYAHMSTGKTTYNAMNQKSLAIREFGSADAPKMMGYFTTYGALAGLFFGIITLIISYIVYGLARIAKWDGASGLGLAVAYGLFAFYGYEFTYLGPGTVTWANGITAFLGPPLLWSSLIVFLLGVASIVFVIRKKGVA